MRIETNRLLRHSSAGACHSGPFGFAQDGFREAQSKNSAGILDGFATGSLDFARDDVLIYPSDL